MSARGVAGRLTKAQQKAIATADRMSAARNDYLVPRYRDMGKLEGEIVALGLGRWTRHGVILNKSGLEVRRVLESE